MHRLRIRSGPEEAGYLLVTFFIGLFSKEKVLAVGLAFPRQTYYIGKYLSYTLKLFSLQFNDPWLCILRSTGLFPGKCI